MYPKYILTKLSEKGGVRGFASDSLLCPPYSGGQKQGFGRAVPSCRERSISRMEIELYILKEIVTRHGGEIEVASQENQGSTFTVWLSLLKENEQ